MKPQDVLAGRGSLWIFGYGSLVWKPDFKYRRSEVGHVKGYKRRFWHGDNFHRGDDDLPGRVVTLIEERDQCTWGVAFEVTGAQVAESLKYLDVREAVRGGYVTKVVEFHPRGGHGPPVPALVYIATPDNPTYLGPASPDDIAARIVACRGKTGHNVEYLLRLAEFMRASCPEVDDAHLFSIEVAALARLSVLL
ncbi:glutathione-specific gamma-glutamylcyclotransferase 1 isoform X1 [Denticeps clupeoides]|uniref:glutathione-specific gamma-glutamylcyclotransferase 1 isoform X1 n=1 Tax=Denticeps clupeoides TaxID=299321 RepID=UPI0010A59344|nr:glutathione-specific gamma-glutamylcyclotransferase 1 isoform X1 [Denticeps clupeoides]